MKPNATSLVLAVALAGAGLFALFRGNPAVTPPPETRAVEASPEPPVEPSNDLPPNHPAIGNAGPLPPGATLPPNHPPIGAGVPMNAGSDEAEPEPQAIAWKVPAAWSSLPNPSTMRIATHRVPHVAKDADDAELSISRAGGDVEANIQRWVGQFGGAATPVRREKTVRGFKIAVVQVTGTYQGGMGPSSGPHQGWALLGAVVTTPSRPYFFKLTGPEATVLAARTGFDALLDSITAATP